MCERPGMEVGTYFTNKSISRSSFEGGAYLKTWSLEGALIRGGGGGLFCMLISEIENIYAAIVAFAPLQDGAQCPSAHPLGPLLGVST